MQKRHDDEFMEEISKRRPTQPNTPINAKLLNFSDGSTGVVFGITKREYFAAKIMQGLVSGNKRVPLYLSTADWAVYLADDLIKSLNKEEITLDGKNIQP